MGGKVPRHPARSGARPAPTRVYVMVMMATSEGCHPLGEGAASSERWAKGRHRHASPPRCRPREARENRGGDGRVRESGSVDSPVSARTFSGEQGRTLTMMAAGRSRRPRTRSSARHGGGADSGPCTRRRRQCRSFHAGKSRYPMGTTGSAPRVIEEIVGAQTPTGPEAPSLKRSGPWIARRHQPGPSSRRRRDGRVRHRPRRAPGRGRDGGGRPQRGGDRRDRPPAARPREAGRLPQPSRLRGHDRREPAGGRAPHKAHERAEEGHGHGPRGRLAARAHHDAAQGADPLGEPRRRTVERREGGVGHDAPTDRPRGGARPRRGRDSRGGDRQRHARQLRLHGAQAGSSTRWMRRTP